MKIKRSGKIAITVVLAGVALAVGIYPVIHKGSHSVESSNTLKVYITQNNGHEDTLLSSMISDFKAKYPNIKIDKVTFDSSTGAGINQYNQRLLNDTLSGSGPDVLELDPQNEDIYKLEKSGMLEDMKPFIEKDQSFHREDFNTKVLDVGLFNGKQLLLPVDYYVNGYITSKQLLENNHITLPQNTNLIDFMNALNPYISTINGDKSKTLFATPISITDFLANSGVKFIDYQNKKTYFDSADFKDVIDAYKKVYNSSTKESDLESVSGEEGIDGIKNGTSLFSCDMLSVQNPQGILSSESELKGLTGNSQVIDTLPSYSGGDQITALAGICLAINSGSNNKSAAYNFVKTALFDDVQTSKVFAIPVNKKAMTDIKSNYVKSDVGKTEHYSKNTNIVYQKPSQNLEAYYDKITNDIGDCSVQDCTVNQLMTNELTPYFEGKESYESVVNSLKNKIDLYLNE